MRFILSKFIGPGIVQKALRGSVVTMGGYAIQQFLRLTSNIVLAHLLFPEAFGIMALVTVFLTGLQQFSDVGIGQSVVQSDRGDDPVFTDTAWTLKIIRGVILWIIATSMAWPLAHFYDQPILIEILPISAFALLATGLVSVKIDLAKRHLNFTRLTLLDILTQIIGLAVTITLAYYLRSIWALVYGTLGIAIINLLIIYFLMPGRRDRFALERPAVVEIIKFGKWLFLATIANFILLNADKLLIGRYVTVEILGIYNIGYFLSSFPLMLSRVANIKVLVPFFRKSHPSESRHLFLRARKLQLLTSGSMIGLILFLAVTGTWLVDLLYDDRYARAGIILVILTAMNIPQIAMMPYDQSILATGSSRNYFFVMSVKAVIYLGCIWVGLEHAGLFGAIVAQGVAFVIAYPYVVFLARRHKVWDPVYDLIMGSITLLTWVAIWFAYHGQIALLTVA